MLTARAPIFLPALLSGALTYLAHFPMGLGFLGWIALVPLLTLARHPGPRWRIYLAAYLGGVLFYLPALRWLPTTDSRMNIAWAFLVLYGSLYPMVGLALVRRLDRSTAWPLPLTAACVWTGLEFVKGNILTGFPWYLFAHTQHDVPYLIQVADLGGAWMVSFLVVAVNGWLAELWLATAPESRWSRHFLTVQGSVLTLLLVATLGYGAYRLNEETMVPGPVIALVQSDVAQGYRNEGYAHPGAVRDFVEEHLFRLTDQAAIHRPALIVWPETAIGGDFYHNPNDVPVEKLANAVRQIFNAPVGRVPDAALIADVQSYFIQSKSQAMDAALRWRTSLLLGLNTRVPTESAALPRYNSGVFIDRGGFVNAIYHKIHCVPFGEYAPLGWLKDLMPFDYPYMIHPGSEWPRMELRRERTDEDVARNPEGEPKSRDVELGRFGVLICYEDTDPNVARPYGGSDGKPPVDFLVNISNDGWFGGTAEHAEHLAICRFRAIENRRTIARSVNMGISAVVDSNGRVIQPTARPMPAQVGLLAVSDAGLAGIPWMALGLQAAHPMTLWEIGPNPEEWKALPVSRWKDYETRPGVLLANIPIDRRSSLYVTWGDWFPWTCWGVVFVGLLLPWCRPHPEKPSDG